MSSVVVEEITQPFDGLLEAMGLLVGELSTSSARPSAGQVSDIIASPTSHLLVARHMDEIVGMLTLVVFPIPTGTRGRIEDVIVRHRNRGQGFGEALVNSALSLARTHHVKTIDLTSRPTRTEASRLYLKLGFVKRDTNVYRFAFE